MRHQGRQRSWGEEPAPDQRDRLAREGIVTDLSQVPPEFLARARAKGRALLEARGVITTAGRENPGTPAFLWPWACSR